MFAVFRDPEKGELHVYYGFELLEVVPDVKTSPRFKLMVAQLYNAGVKGVTLVEVFCVDPKYMRKWGRALKSGDPETLVNALRGRGPRKFTPEIRAFVRRRFPVLHAENNRNYSSRIRQEILEIFNVQLSGEALRPFFNELKARRQAGKPAPEDAERGLRACEEDPPNPPPVGQSLTQGNGEAEEPSAKKGALIV